MYRLILTIFFLQCSTPFAFGQDQQTEQTGLFDGQSAWMEQQAELMLPWMEKMLQTMLRAEFNALAEPDMAPKLAQFMRNYYEALIEAGFKEQQALELTKNLHIPTISMPGK